MTRCPSTRQGLRCRRHAPHPGRLHGDGEVEWSDAEADPMTPSAWAMERARPLVSHTTSCWIRTEFERRPCDCGYDVRLEMAARALDAAHAQGRRDERADVVAQLRAWIDGAPDGNPLRVGGGTHMSSTGQAYAIRIADALDIPAAADAGRADRGEG